MTENPYPAQVRPFRLILAPHRSLGAKGFVLLMTLFGGVSFVAGIVFMRVGAWPVLGFFGLDVLLLYGAFKLNYRSGRLYETIDISPTDVVLARFHPDGRSERFVCNPFFARVDLGERVDGQTFLSLRARDRSVLFGTFLTDDERREVAVELRRALVAVRG
jgi:uncharacterized membrane protein